MKVNELDTQETMVGPRAAIYTKQQRADTLMQIVPLPHCETDSYLIRNYTLLKISWDRLRQEV